MAQLGFDYTGSGTSEDPFHVKTVGGFIYCVGQQGAIVFVDNDLDAKHDPVYREGIDEAISVSASYVYGICEPYSISKEYHVGEKCTYFDPDYGNRVYTCVRDCSCMSPLDTTYFSQGEPETAYACLRGLKVTSESFMNASNGSSNIINICIDSCVHKKTGSVSYPTFSGGGVNKLYFSYCKIAMAIFCNGYTCSVDTKNTYLTKCAEYYKFVHQDIADRPDSRGVFIGYRSMCTVEFYNLATIGVKHGYTVTNSGGVIVSNASYTSFVGDVRIKVIDSSSSMTDTIAIYSSSDCFFAFTLTPYSLTGDPAVKFQSCSGISVFNKEQPETVATIDYSDYVILATTSQCRDRDWLVSKGFIVG